MDTWMHLTQEEVFRLVPFILICETRNSSRWETGRRRRMYNQVFTEQEKKKIPELCRKAHIWAISKGVPAKGVKMTLSTYKLWHKLAHFCINV